MNPPTDAPEPRWKREQRHIAAIAARLGSSSFPTGDHAALRRMQPAQPGGHAMIAAERLLHAAGVDPRSLGERERWTLAIHCLALAQGRHNPAIPFGKALADLHFSEPRLTRLLVDDYGLVADWMPRIARFLASQGAAADWVEPVRILLHTGTRHGAATADRARMQIARSYARATSAAPSSSP